MSVRPRPPGQRDQAVDALRAAVLAAARRALSEPAGGPAFSVDTVAAKAGIARSVVHRQFGSAAGMLEALIDDILAHGSLAAELPRAFALSDPLQTLAEFIAVFGRLWESERVVMRRLRSLAGLDPQLERALLLRDEYRREGLRKLIGRLAQQGVKLARGPAEPLDVLFALIAFETFDNLAGPGRSILEVLPAVQFLVFAAFGLSPAPRPDAPG
jgi:AcrR family transcriptional regulator